MRQKEEIIHKSNELAYKWLLCDVCDQSLRRVAFLFFFWSAQRLHLPAVVHN